MYYHQTDRFYHNPYSVKYQRNKSILQTDQPSNGFYYTVQYGESIFSISQAFHVPMMDIIDVNRLSPPYVIYPGQRLLIPESGSIPYENGRIYIVQPGDTLYTLAQNFNTTVDRIAAFNNILEPDLIYPGQRLIIPSEER